MFICETCHEKTTCKNGFIEGLMRSRGRCEDCGDLAACLDCQGYKAAKPKPEPQRCGRCDNPVPCGCYSHEARLGIPYPSSKDQILEAYAEQYGQQLAQLIAIRQLVTDPFWEAELAGTDFLGKLKAVLDGT